MCHCYPNKFCKSKCCTLKFQCFQEICRYLECQNEFLRQQIYQCCLSATVEFARLGLKTIFLTDMATVQCRLDLEAWIWIHLVPHQKVLFFEAPNGIWGSHRTSISNQFATREIIKGLTFFKIFIEWVLNCSFLYL